MGRRRDKGRDVSGIVLLDKPVRMGSNEALQIVKRFYHAKKAGHTGSLDQLASGLLPVCLGEATKMSGFLLDADKRYRSVFRLGEKTTTGDAEGEVIETGSVEGISRSDVERVLAEFRGTIQQIPPMHSAVKHQGQRLYQLARQGVVVERKPRTVTVHELRLIEYRGALLEVEIFCSKGTYIRTLAEDVGERLACGGRVENLRRTGSGPFDETGMVSLERLRESADRGIEVLDAHLLPMDFAVAEWPEVNLTDDVAYYLCRGQAVLVPRAPTAGWVRIYGSERRFLGVGEVLDDGRIAPRRLVR